MTNARELTARLLDLLRREQTALADFLLGLADFDAKRLWQGLGYTSLFDFLHRELGMSKGAAHYRKTAAELVRRVPEVVEPLRDGRLCITSIIELAKVLTPENREEVLPRFFHCSRQEAKIVSAELRPADAAPHRTVVTAVVAGGPRVAAPPLPAAPVGQAGATWPTLAVDAPSRVQPVELAKAPAAPISLIPVNAPRAVAEPLNADLRRLHVTVSKRFMQKLEVARDALSHSHPNADAEAILEEGLDLLIERAAKRKGIVARPRTEQQASSPALSSARHIPAAVRREVWLRDGGRCQWRLESGEVCGSTHRVQFDHVEPFALGGRATVENLRVLCAGHNQLAARRVFGDAVMDRFARRSDSSMIAESRE